MNKLCNKEGQQKIDQTEKSRSQKKLEEKKSKRKNKRVNKAYVI